MIELMRTTWKSIGLLGRSRAPNTKAIKRCENTVAEM